MREPIVHCDGVAGMDGLRLEEMMPNGGNVLNQGMEMS